MLFSDHTWVIAYVPPGKEAKVASALPAGVVHFLPRATNSPLFAGYLFVGARDSLTARNAIRDTKSYLDVIIPEDQSRLRRELTFLAEHSDIQHGNTPPHAVLVRFKAGPLRGTAAGLDKNRVFIKIGSLNQVVSVPAKPEQLEPLE